jgi:hypothetical protein
MQNLASTLTVRNRCIIYIDGFNFYYGLFKGRPECKWLNLQSFFEQLRINEDVIKIKYFTAIVDERLPISRKRDRQKRYLNALSSLPKFELILGFFQDREKTCRADCKQVYIQPEEKKTDVNLSVALIDDAIKNRADSMVIVTGDSDIQPAIAWVHTNYPKITLTVYVPALPEARNSRRADYYRKIRVAWRFLPTVDILAHQFPMDVNLADGKVVKRPSEWVAV